MPITAASIAAQRLDEYLQRAVANCEDTPQINLRHSSNPGASLLSHISRSTNQTLDFRKDSANIRPSEVRKAGGKVTTAGGLIKVENDGRPSSPKRAKLDEAVLTKVRVLERGRDKIAKGVSKIETKTKHDKTTSVDVLSRNNAASNHLVERNLKLEQVRQACETHNNAGNTIVLSGKTDNDTKRFNILIKARESGKSSENIQNTDSGNKQPASSEKLINRSSNLKSGLISLKTLAELEKRLSPQNLSFRVSEKVQTNLNESHSERRPRPLIPALQLSPRRDQIASEVAQNHLHPQRQGRSSPLVPASQLGSRFHHRSSEVRLVSQSHSNPASLLNSRVSQLSRETSQETQGQSDRISHASVTVSPRIQQTDPDTETETDIYHQPGSDLDEDFISSSSHLPYENIFNPNSPHSRPNIGLSEMFDDSGFDYFSNFLNHDKGSDGSTSSSSASMNGSGSPMRNSLKMIVNQGRILSGHGSSSAFSLVKDSSNSTLSFESPNVRTAGSTFHSRTGNLNKPTPVLTLLRQSASHTMTSSSAVNKKVNLANNVDKAQRTALCTKLSTDEKDSEKSDKDLIKQVKPVIRSETRKKIQLPKPGELRRAGPYLLGKTLLLTEKFRHLNYQQLL